MAETEMQPRDLKGDQSLLTRGFHSVGEQYALATLFFSMSTGNGPVETDLVLEQALGLRFL
jgi:hypothetical protein